MSEIARLRAQIAQECQAMQLGFSGYAVTARHDIIAQRYNNLGACQEQLGKLIGEEAAGKATFEIYMSTVKEE